MKELLFILISLLSVFYLTGQVNPSDIPLNINEKLVNTESGYVLYTYYGDKTLKELQPVILFERIDTTYNIHPISLKEEMTLERKYFIPHGLRSRYDEDGALMEKYNYDDGAYELFFPDGAVKISGTLVKGVKQNRWRYFNEIYLLVKVEHYEDGLHNGPYKEFYEDGQLKVDGAYKLIVEYDSVNVLNSFTLKEETKFASKKVSVKCGEWSFYKAGVEKPARIEENRKCK